MKKLLIASTVVWGLLAACGGGPEIKVDLNVRNLCQVAVSGESESRCTADANCSQGFCWRPELPTCNSDGDCPNSGEKCTGGHCQKDCSEDANCSTGMLCTGGICQKRGYCRECQTDGNCNNGFKCDYGHCHKICGQDGDCPVGVLCTAGVCRRPHTAGTEINFCNTGSGTLEVYVSQTKLFGEQDACAFSRIEWALIDADSVPDTVQLKSEECLLTMRALFTPPQKGDYYAVIEVHSNATNMAVLPIALHGQAVEAACDPNLGEVCTPECKFTADDPQLAKILQNRPTPNCQ